MFAVTHIQENVGEIVVQIVDRPVVGFDYIVTCLVAYRLGRFSFPIPLVCEPHTDPQLNSPTAKKKHHHIDWRFVNDELMTYLQNHFAEFDFQPTELAFNVLVASDFDVFEEHELRCLRKAPAATVSFSVLKREYKNCVIDVNHPICPHRGVPLEVNRGKCLAVCQGHGLVWNLETGKMSSRGQQYGK